jgi:hypothetical protein
MTPRMLFALRRRRLAEMRWIEVMASRLTAAVCNFGFARPKEFIDERAFMLHPFPVKAAPPPPEEPPGVTLLRMLEKLPKGLVKRI